MYKLLQHIFLSFLLFLPSVYLQSASISKGDLSRIPFEDLGSPMWVVYRDGSSSWRNVVPVQKTEGKWFYSVEKGKWKPFTHGEIPPAGRAFIHLPAVQSNYNGYIPPNSVVPEKIHVQAGDVLIRRFARDANGERVFYLEAVKPENFTKDYVLANGAEVELAGVRSERFIPKPTSRAEAKMILAALEAESKNGVNYSIVPENFLQKILLQVEESSLQPRTAEYRLAPETGYVFSATGQKITIFSGTLLKYENGALVRWISPDFYTGLKASFRHTKTTNGNLNYPQIITLSNKTGTAASLESLLDRYLSEHRFDLESFKFAKDLPFYTPHILEGYLRFQEINEQIKINFPQRHSSPAVAEKLRMDIAQAKQIRQSTRSFIRQERFSFEDLLSKRLSKGVRSGLSIENLFRKISHGTLLSGILVVGGLEAVEALLLRLSEEEPNLSSNANDIAISVGQREQYLSLLQQNPQLLVYMPSSIGYEALCRHDFDRYALLAEAYLFNNFLEETQIPDSFAAQLMARIEQEYQVKENIKQDLASIS